MTTQVEINTCYLVSCFGHVSVSSCRINISFGLQEHTYLDQNWDHHKALVFDQVQVQRSEDRMI